MTTTARKLTVSARRIAEQGPDYLDTICGTRILHRDSEGTVRVGEVIPSPIDRVYAAVRFADGRWARLDNGKPYRIAPQGV